LHIIREETQVESAFGGRRITLAALVVDNRGGAGGLIGMELTAKALPDMKKNLESQGMAPTGGSPQRYGERIRKDYDRWVKLIKEANIKAD
jgi:tripartite-type tricarboxylate transporter receptor subunit TctC